MSEKKKAPAKKAGTFTLAMVGKKRIELPAGTKLSACLEKLGLSDVKGYTAKRDGTPFSLDDADTHFSADEVVTIARDIKGG